MAAILARLAAGFGLFFLGLHLVGEHLRQASSRRFRSLLAHFTGNVWAGSALGLLAGAVMQSTSAITVILASMTASGLITIRRALPIVAWSNVGTTVLVFVTVLDVRLAVLYLLGLSATAFAFSPEARWKPLFGVLLGVSLLFFGVDEMRLSAEGFQQFEWFQAVVQQARTSFVLAFAVGTLLSFLTQSTTAVMFLAVTLVKAGVLGAEETMLIIYGGNVGSTFARMLLTGSIKGSARQITRFQDVFKIVGSALFVVLFVVEVFGHVPLVKALVGLPGGQLGTQMALVNLVYNTTMAVLLLILLRPVQRLLEHFWPARATEDLARLQYLHPQALSDAETALDLVEKEQSRLTAVLPDYLSVLREGGKGPTPTDLRALHQSFCILAGEISSYLTSLLQLHQSAETSERLTNVQNRHGVIELLEDTIHQLTVEVSQSRPSAAMAPLLRNSAEALDFLLMMLGEAVTSLDPEDATFLENLCADRGELLGKIRNVYLSPQHELTAADRTLLLALTTLFDRTVWLTRRLATLMQQKRGD